MKTAVIGTGGVGGYFGGLFAKSGADVTFVARGEHYAAIKQHGLVVKTVDGDFNLPQAKVVDSISALDRPDVVIIATKTYGLEAAARELIPVVNEDTIIIPVQNGIDHDLVVKKILPRAQVHPGLTYIISTRTAPGLIEQTAGPKTIFFGARGGGEVKALRVLEDQMKSAGIRATYSPDIEQELWAKFLWVTTFAGVTSLCRCAIGKIVQDPAAFEFYIGCLDEALAVARAHKISLRPNIREEIISKSEQYRHTGSESKASMLVDIENGRPTEIEALNGTIVRLARAAEIAVPRHEAIYNAVRLGS